MNFTPGIYRHFKGGLYYAECVATHVDNLGVEVVVYRDAVGHTWLRDLKEFMEEIERDGKKMPRFELIKVVHDHRMSVQQMFEAKG